jgi:hypothetical protein
MNKPAQMALAKLSDTFSELLFGEQILLWGVRIWVSGHKNSSNIQELLRSAYSHAGVPRAHAALDTMMEMITTAGYGIMDVRCPSSSKISDDEHRLMAAIAAWQHGTVLCDGDAYLECWAKPAILRILRPVARMLAQALKEGSILIRPRPWSLQPLIAENENAYNELQSATIH